MFRMARSSRSPAPSARSRESPFISAFRNHAANESSRPRRGQAGGLDHRKSLAQVREGELPDEPSYHQAGTKPRFPRTTKSHQAEDPLASWDVFHGDRLELERGLHADEIRAAVARGELHDDDLVRPAGTTVAWARLADFPELLQAAEPSPATAAPALEIATAALSIPTHTGTSDFEVQADESASDLSTSSRFDDACPGLAQAGSRSRRREFPGHQRRTRGAAPPARNRRFTSLPLPGDGSGPRKSRTKTKIPMEYRTPPKARPPLNSRSSTTTTPESTSAPRSLLPAKSTTTPAGWHCRHRFARLGRHPGRRGSRR